MRRIFAELVSAAERRDEADFFEVRGRLHNFWTDRCGNASLRRLLKTWKMRLSVNRLGALHDFDRVLKDNERLVIACEERDAPLGEALMASLTHYGREMIRERISRN
ncbi:MAG: FCD domain-containing protein [Sphingomonas sp.]